MTPSDLSGPLRSPGRRRTATAAFDRRMLEPSDREAGIAEADAGALSRGAASEPFGSSLQRVRSIPLSRRRPRTTGIDVSRPDRPRRGLDDR
ncbi:hypothetical protein [Natrinema caseinilyticum]|uniref:hypothetical protein n=1 Tax=Natrinema caseinilyticum TaxID=2961570 RepID=UPI0020C25058|nr:hypothetical protein [Natrinema caseinilyticum]